MSPETQDIDTFTRHYGGLLAGLREYGISHDPLRFNDPAYVKTMELCLQTARSGKLRAVAVPTIGSAAPDMVNHPPHYKSASGLESIDVIEAFALPFHLGNVIKYVLRAGKKGEALPDLQKARWYLDRYIGKLKP